MKVELITQSKKDEFPFLAFRKLCDGIKVPVVVCHEKDLENYLVYFPEDNYEGLQIVRKSSITRLPSGSQIILTQR